MTEPTTGPVDRATTLRRWPLVLASYTAALLSFAASAPYALPAPLNLIARGPARGPLEWAAPLAWCGLTVWAFAKWGRRAWPTLLGAPVALLLPISFMAIFAMCLMGKCLWWPG